MALRTLRSDMKLSGKRVLVRIDANVPIRNGKAVDGRHGKVARAAVGLEWLRQKGARLVVMTHLGRPGGKRVPAYSVRPIAKRMGALMGAKVPVARDVTGPRVEKAVDRLKDGDLLLLENLRFDPREKNNDEGFAHELAALGDLYVNDAFAVCHRAHASVSALARELPSYAGPIIQAETQVLDKVLKKPKKPLVLVLGGLKMSSKLPVLKRLLPSARHVLVGGALATVFLKARHSQVGKSVYDQEAVGLARELLRRWEKKLILPVDAMAARSVRSNAHLRRAPIGEVKASERIVDLGPRTVDLYSHLLEDAGTIVWNGPLGMTEYDRFSAGTREIATAIAGRTGSAMTIVGGGDTAPVIDAAGLAESYTLLSTGGGAMLRYLAGKDLPGLLPLQK